MPPLDRRITRLRWAVVALLSAIVLSLGHALGWAVYLAGR